MTYSKNLTANSFFEAYLASPDKLFYNALSFYRSQNILGWSTFFVSDQKNIFILCQSQTFSKIGFCAGTNVFEEPLNADKFLGWLKKFGPAQNILVRIILDLTV